CAAAAITPLCKTTLELKLLKYLAAAGYTISCYFYSLTFKVFAMSQKPSQPLPSYLNPDNPCPWAVFLEQVDRVAPYLGDLADWVETLKHPERTLVVNIPVKMDDGSIEHFEGYRVPHNLSCGPGKGGVRFQDRKSVV